MRSVFTKELQNGDKTTTTTDLVTDNTVKPEPLQWIGPGKIFKSEERGSTGSVL